MKTDERPIFSLDYPFIGCGTMLLFIIFAPLMWLAAVRFVPQDAGALDAAYHRGALEMCLDFASTAGVPAAQAEPICEEMVAGLDD